MPSFDIETGQLPDQVGFRLLTRPEIRIVRRMDYVNHEDYRQAVIESHATLQALGLAYVIVTLDEYEDKEEDGT